ncbi:MAG: hypothetical protein AAFR61_11305 [Bacteroidota bacterium]
MMSILRTHLMYVSSFLLLTFSLINKDLVAQVDYQDRGNRYEGTKEKPVSAKPLILVAALAYPGIEPYQKWQDQSLKVAFYAPKNLGFQVHARETDGHIIYRMDSKPSQAPRGWHEFTPWEVDEVLTRVELFANNLGVLVNFDLPGKVIAPAVVYHTRKPQQVNSYHFSFLPLAGLSYLKFEVYQGYLYKKALKPEFLLKRESWGERAMESKICFDYDLAFSKLDLPPEWSGWITLRVRGKRLSDNKSVKETFYFYHAASNMSR